MIEWNYISYKLNRLKCVVFYRINWYQSLICDLSHGKYNKAIRYAILRRELIHYFYIHDEIGIWP